MNNKEYWQQTIAGVIAAISTLGTLMAIYDSEFELAGLNLLLAGAGYYAYKYFRKKYLHRVKYFEEQKILELLSFQKEALNVEQMASMSSLPLGETQTLLDALQKKGVIEIVVTEAGALVYQLPKTSSISNLGAF